VGSKAYFDQFVLVAAFSDTYAAQGVSVRELKNEILVCDHVSGFFS
jgi:hypothetical protein